VQLGTSKRRTASARRGDVDAAPSRTERILERVRAIPEGLVQTYGDIDPAAPRLVGQVLAATDIDVPWHRVVRADGSLAVGRLQRERLLQEGVPMRGERVDLRLARWPRLSP
jgi:methylated-DNA-protein-cysteine methyltransferase related protein